MPELPEVESARAVIAAAALKRPIADVDDTDSWECRPHAPGEIRSALVGRSLTAVHRRGKSIWCETAGVEGATDAGPILGLHLGMSGRIVITASDGESIEGGDYFRDGRSAAEQADAHPEWTRFAITFADGGALRLFDKRRLGRVRLDPDIDALGPDAAGISRQVFVERIPRGHAAIKARLLDQSVLAGVGNLLADETLWQARIDPRRPADELTAAELSRLHECLVAATDSAIRLGGVHTGEIVEHRHRGGHCPRCGAELRRATVAGRTTFWCPREQT